MFTSIPVTIGRSNHLWAFWNIFPCSPSIWIGLYSHFITTLHIPHSQYQNFVICTPSRPLCLYLELSSITPASSTLFLSNSSSIYSILTSYIIQLYHNSIWGFRISSDWCRSLLGPLYITLRSLADILWFGASGDQSWHYLGSVWQFGV